MTKTLKSFVFVCTVIGAFAMGCGRASHEDSRATVDEQLELRRRLDETSNELTQLKAQFAELERRGPDGPTSATARTDDSTNSPDNADFADLIASARRGSDRHRELEAMTKKIQDEVLKPAGPLEPAKLASNFVTWNDLTNAIGTNFEPGARAGKRFMLKSGRIMLLERQNALDILFAPDALGIAAVTEFVSSDIFRHDERERLSLLIGNHHDTQDDIGRFRTSLSATTETDGELPKYWIRLSIELISSDVLPFDQPSGALTNDELFTVSRFARLNRRIRDLLSPSRPSDEIAREVRKLNILAEGAGVSSNQTLQLLENRLSVDAPGVAVAAMTGSLAFRIGLAKDNLGSWRQGAIPTAPDATQPADTDLPTQSPFSLR